MRKINGKSLNYSYLHLYMDVRNIIHVMKSRRMRHKGRLTYMDNRNTHTALWENHKERDHF